MTMLNGCIETSTIIRRNLVPHYVQVRAENLKPGDVFIRVTKVRDGWEHKLNKAGTKRVKVSVYKTVREHAIVLTNYCHEYSPYAKCTSN